MPSKSKSGSNICLEKDNNLSFDPNDNCEIYKRYFGSLAHSLLNKLPAAKNVFGINSVHKYYEHLNSKTRNFLKTTDTADVLNMLQAIKPSKAAELDGINGIFLKEKMKVTPKLHNGGSKMASRLT